MKSKADVYDALVLLGVVLKQPQEEGRLRFYVEALAKYDIQKVLKAIHTHPERSGFFPQLVDLINNMKGPEIPTDELANQIAGEIMDAIPRFGRYQEQEAKTSLGASFGIVERFGGGWQYLCSIQNDEVPTVRAQLRELAKAFINRSKRECSELGIEFSLNTAPIQIPQRENKPGLKLVSFNDLTS
jgi:hypothetical protein